MKERHSENQIEKIPVPWRLYIEIGFIALLVVGAMWYLLQQTKNTYAIHDSLLVTLSRIELKVTTSHLWFEEILSGDSTESIEAVRELLDQAERHLQALTGKVLDSGEHVRPDVAVDTHEDIGLFHLYHESHVIPYITKSIELVAEKLIQFRKIFEKRYNAIQTSGPGTEIDQRFDQVFIELLKGISEITNKIQDSKANHLAEYRIIQTSLIFICLVLAVLSAVILHLFERRRAKDLLTVMRGQEELQESEEKYRSMMEAMDDAAYICSPDFRVEYMNPAMTKRIGYDATGEPCHKVMHGLDEKCPWCIHGKVMQGEHVKNEVISPKNGKTYHVSNSPIFHTDGSTSKLTIFRDITETKRMEEQLQQSQKMESIGTLAGGIAHDFNNILFPMMGFAEMALDDVPKGNPLRNNIKRILQGTKRASDLVKQILAFSRQSGQVLKPLKVQLTVKEVLKLMRSSLPSTIEIKHHINNECDLVMADPTQIHQVAMNLMTNAFQTMEDEGGVLEVTLKEIELGLDDLTDQSMAPGAYVCLTVADTGSGMDQSVINRIFEPYFTTKENGKGTGLGLAVVHGIVKSYKGDIKVYSELGEGTAFHVYLPVIKSQVETEETEAVTPVQKGTERILLVDDEEPIVSMETQMLERLGYDVTERTSSIEALKVFRASPDKFDLVITDMTMPNMTGVQLSQKLLEIKSDIPIIICTGFSTKIDGEKAKVAGIRGYVMKPVVMSEIAKKIREVLDQE